MSPNGDMNQTKRGSDEHRMTGMGDDDEDLRKVTREPWSEGETGAGLVWSEGFPGHPGWPDRGGGVPWGGPTGRDIMERWWQASVGGFQVGVTLVPILCA